MFTRVDLIAWPCQREAGNWSYHSKIIRDKKMKKKIVISDTCKFCPSYEWKDRKGEIGFCKPDLILLSLAANWRENNLNHIILKEGIPWWCPLPEEKDCSICKILSFAEDV